MLLKYWPELIAAGSFIMLFLGTWWIPIEDITHNPDLNQIHAIIGQVARGHLTGAYRGQSNGATFANLEPGDVILCHNRGGGYGYWTHAVLYMGHNRVIDANDFIFGTRLYPLRHYQNYDRVKVLRAKIPGTVRKQIVQYARNAMNRVYDPFAALDSRRDEYCSKLIWESYGREGILLCAPKRWILPDDLSRSQTFTQLGSWGW